MEDIKNYMFRFGCLLKIYTNKSLTRACVVQTNRFMRAFYHNFLYIRFNCICWRLSLSYVHCIVYTIKYFIIMNLCTFTNNKILHYISHIVFVISFFFLFIIQLTHLYEMPHSVFVCV